MSAISVTFKCIVESIYNILTKPQSQATNEQAVLTEQVNSISKEAMDQLSRSFRAAIEKGDVDSVKKILPKIDPNVRGECYYPLLFATCFRRTEIVKIILADERTKPNIKGDHGETAFELAVKLGHVKLLEALLADQRVDPNMLFDKSGVTPLKSATLSMNEELVKALIANERTKPNMQNQEDETALMTAAELNAEKVVETLLADKRVDSTILNHDGKNAFDLAAERGHEEVCRLLSL